MKKRSTYIRATLKPLAMPASKAISPKQQAELERRQAAFDKQPLKPKP
jgi:hypothetical protein